MYWWHIQMIVKSKFKSLSIYNKAMYDILIDAHSTCVLRLWCESYHCTEQTEHTAAMLASVGEETKADSGMHV